MKLQIGPLGIVLVLLAVIGLLWYVTQYKPIAVTPAVPAEYEGEFKTVFIPDKVTGSWLTLAAPVQIQQNQQITISAKSSLAGVGSIYPLAFAFSFDDAFRKVVITVKELNSNAIIIKDVYIVPNEKGYTLDSSKAVYRATIDTTKGEAEIVIEPLMDTPYDELVLVVEARVVGSVSTGADLFRITFDGKSKGDVTDFAVVLRNA